MRSWSGAAVTHIWRLRHDVAARASCAREQRRPFEPERGAGLLPHRDAGPRCTSGPSSPRSDRDRARNPPSRCIADSARHRSVQERPGRSRQALLLRGRVGRSLTQTDRPSATASPSSTGARPGKVPSTKRRSSCCTTSPMAAGTRPRARGRAGPVEVSPDRSENLCRSKPASTRYGATRIGKSAGASSFSMWWWSSTGQTPSGRSVSNDARTELVGGAPETAYRQRRPAHDLTFRSHRGLQGGLDRRSQHLEDGDVTRRGFSSSTRRCGH